jgi:hypothetical protein
MKLNPGDRINILLNGDPIITEIDKDGVQRFVANEVVDWLFSTGQISMHDMCLAFHKGQFDLYSYQEFYMSLGYSVCGFMEFFGPGSGIADHTGEPAEILNPVWEKEEEVFH